MEDSKKEAKQAPLSPLKRSATFKLGPNFGSQNPPKTSQEPQIAAGEQMMNLQVLRQMNKKQGSFKLPKAAPRKSPYLPEDNLKALPKHPVTSPLEEAIREAERLLNRQQPKFSLPMDAHEQKPVDALVMALERVMISGNMMPNISNTQEYMVNMQVAFQNESPQKMERCKSIIEYISEMKNCTQRIVEVFTKGAAIGKSIIGNEDDQAKEQLALKLKAKEDECLTLKSKLDRMILSKIEAKPLIPGLEIPQTAQDIDYAHYINEQQTDFTRCFKFITQISDDIFNQAKSFDSQYQQMQDKFESQLTRLKTIQESIIGENSKLYDQKIELASRVDSMSKNTKYLEDRLATTMTQKEEQIIKLKSEIVIYKSKIVSYKIKLKESINGFETKKIQDFQADREQEVAALTNQIEQYKNLSQSLKQENIDLLKAKEDAIQYREDSQNQHKQQLHEQNLIITELSDRLKDIDSDYLQQLSKVDNIREVTQKRLNIEEKERTLNSLKLEYLVSNYRKLQVQKQFLLKALDKDMQSLTRELRKAELEMQRDIYVSSQSAQTKLAGLHNIIKDSLRYVKEVLGFMNFDVDQVRDEVEPKREGSGEMVGQMEQEQEDPIKRFEKNRLESHSKIHQEPTQEAVTKPFKLLTLDQCFHRHIYELSEVLLSVLGEVYKESKAQTSTDTLQLMDLLQQKTDKNLVREIYKKFFAPSRIHFASYINRLEERTLDLQSEKNELKQQVQRLTQQIQEYLNENERQHEEDMMFKQQQKNQHLQEMVEEEIKEQELVHEMASFSPLRGSGPIRHGNNANNQLHLPSSLREDSTIGDGTNRDQQQQQQQNKASTSLNFKDIFTHLQNQTPSRSPVAAAVASAIFKQQEKRISEILQIENSALKERVRETRLIFQRQIDELKETLKLEKEKHEGQMSRIKAEYGQDLNALNRNQKTREQNIIQILEEEQNQEIEKIKLEFTKLSQSNKQEYNEKISKLHALLDASDKKNEEQERELRKLKKLSNNVFQAGWGTFSVVFEEVHKKNIFLPSLTSNAIANFGQSLTPKSPLEGLKENLVKKLLRQASREMHENQSENAFDNEDLQPDMPLEKLSHFIEVGFLMDPKGFKFLDCYKEKTFESNLIKHIFEFQDPIDNFKIQQLQNKVKQQITENFALFNEINPVYISLNLGRNISPFWGDESLSQEKFKLIKREGFYLNGENYVMVNFMKCEQPSYVIRVIAFDNERCLQYSFDLILEDLMMMVYGNMKLLEEDHQNDLCQIILNNLTFIRRRQPQTQKSNAQMEEVSSFTEDNTSISSTSLNLSLFIKANNQVKKSLQPHVNNHIQGTLAVEHKLFFNEHYRTEYDQRNRVILAKHDKKKKGLVQEQSVSTDFEPSMLHESFDLVYSEENIKICDEAEAINLELVRGRMSQHLIIKVAFLESGIKQEIALLSTYISKANLTQQIGSEVIKTQNKGKVLAYVISFEKLYGLDQLIIKITALQQNENQIRQEFDGNSKPTQGSLQYKEHILFLVKKSDKSYLKLQKFEILHTEMRALLFQHSYGYQQSILDFGKLQPLTELCIKIPAEVSQLHTMHLIYRDFGVLRIKKQSDTHLNAESDNENDDEDNITSYVNSYAQYAFYDDLGCLSQGKIHMHIKLGNDNIELSHQVLIGNILNDNEILQLKSDPEILSEKIFNQIVIVQNDSMFEITVNKNVIPMTDIIEELKKAKFQALIDEEDIIQQEFDAKQIGITLQILAESPKIAQITMINRKVFKILSYFVNNLKNYKASEDIYDWQVIHIDAHLRQQAKSFAITLTQTDLKSLVQRLNNQAAPSFDQQSILSSKAKHEDILSLILDSLVLDEEKQSLKVSTSHLRARILDRKTLNQQFRNCGGRFINRLGSLDKTEQNIYLTSLPQIEVSRKLILNLEKEFADKKYDIKIYESTIKGNQKDKSYHFEMFNIEEPSAIFRAEYFCDSGSTGDNFHIERFNIVQQLHQDYEETKFIRDGMVLVIGEKSFPHEIIFLLLEPASNIQWQHIVSSDQLKSNQTRQMKESFIRLVKDKLEQGVLGWKGSFEQVNSLSQLGYQKDLISQDQLDLWQGSLTSALKSDQESIYERTLQLPNKQHAYLGILSDRKFNQLTFSIEQGLHKIQRSFGYETWRESSRFQSGIITLGQENQMIYTLEVSCGYTNQERAVRFTLYHEQGEQCLVDLILADKNLLKPINEDMANQLAVRDELKFAFSTGFKDSFAAFTKLPDIIPSFKSAFLQLNKLKKSGTARQSQEASSKMLYRKVINLEDLQAIVFVKYDTQDEAETLWKVVIFDQKSQIEEDFEFETKYILTQDELNSLNVKNDRIMRDLAKRVLDKRFVLRLVEDDPNAMIKIQDVKDKRRFICYFTEPPAGLAAIQKQNMDFDIRKGFRFSLTDSDSTMPEFNLASEQERLLTQLEKDDLIMDVFEILNSFQLMLRIKTYLRDTLELLSMSDVQEFDIRKELMRDQHSFLMEPHRRVDMAKYIVQNMYYDELRCRVFFLRSQL